MKDAKIMKYVPKKYHDAIESCEKDGDGYWIYLKDGYNAVATGCHTMHGYTISELREDISQGIIEVLEENTEVAEPTEKTEEQKEEMKKEMKKAIKTSKTELKDFPLYMTRKQMEKNTATLKLEYYRNGINFNDVKKYDELVKQVLGALLKKYGASYIIESGKEYGHEYLQVRISY